MTSPGRVPWLAEEGRRHEGRRPGLHAVAVGLIVVLTGFSVAIGADGPASGKRYATTAFMEPDRCAVAWVIQRRIDPQATFEFHPRDAFPEGVVLFDLPESEIKRDARRAAVEVLLDRHGLESEFLSRLRRLVHDVEISAWSSKRPPESLIFEKVMIDSLIDQPDAVKALERCFNLLDTLEEAGGHVENWSELWQGDDGVVRLNIPSVYHVQRSGLANLLRISERVYSGGEPRGREGFESLRQLGVTTILSVDGARPDVESARGEGMRYVHVPLGYNGIPAAAAAAFKRVLAETDGKVYVHCHHGKHRGPAAAAILLGLDEGAPAETRVDVLRLAETSPGYANLWRDVREFDPASVTGPAPELHEVIPVGSFRTEMARLDRIWDRLKQSRKTDWQPDPEHPDVAPAHEALMMQETFVELRRLDDGIRREEELLRGLDEAGARAGTLYRALQDEDSAAASRAYSELAGACRRCHERFRDEAAVRGGS